MSKDILEVEAEEIAHPLEQEIEKTLQKNNVTQAVISALKQKYGHLKLSSIDSKQDYLEIVDARKEVRKVGILAEKITKKGREDANKIRAMWIEKEKEVLAAIAEVQDPLDAEIKKFEDEVARKEEEEKQRKEQEFMGRQTTLLKMEAKYENNSFTLGIVSYEVNNIRDADEEIWQETILPKYKREYDKIETARAEEEKKKQEEAKSLRKEQEAFELKKKEFEKQQQQMQDQMNELQRQKDEAAKIENEKRQAVIKSRCIQLDQLGMKFSIQEDAYIFEDVNIDNKTEISLLDESGWVALVDKIKPTIEQRKLELKEQEEQRKKQEEENIRQEAIKKEQERMAEENRLAEVKKQQEEQQRQEELAKASDKEKWALFVQQLVALSLPEFKSSIYKGKLAQAKEKIEEIQNL